jgi:poly-beta-1,6-N-acetyl-D-glucosamine synthase
MLALLNFFYCGLLLFFTIGIFRIQGKRKTDSTAFISVIVAARNEEKNISSLLKRLSSQTYSANHYEVLIADDRSTDKTAEIISSFSAIYPFIKYIKISTEKEELVGKKNALNEAIKIAQGEILAFTDADCLPSKNWLSEINSHFTDNTDFVVGYAPLIVNPIWLSALKNLERASIFALTAGSFGWNWGITCAARNMAYRKSLFEKVNGFSDIGHLRSGDDDLMLQKMNPYIRQMNFMFTEDSFVPSVDKKNFQEQIYLETRRASKWKYYPFSIKLITLLTFCYYILLGISTLDAMRKKRWHKVGFAHGAKITSEFILLYSILHRLKQNKILLAFPLAELFYLPYFLFFAIKGTFGKYKWKN